MSLVGTVGVAGTVALGASAVGTGVQAGMAGSAQGAAESQYNHGLLIAKQLYDQSRNDINKYMSPYVDSGKKHLAILDSWMDPTATRDTSMPEKPGKKPTWADYHGKGVSQWDQPKQYQKPGLAGMISKKGGV